MTSFGTFQDLMNLTEESLRPVATRLRDVILEIHPDAVEVVRLGDRAATYGFGPKKMSEGYVYVLPYTNWVNLGFYRGADSPNPVGLLEGTGTKLRHVKVRDLVNADTPGLRALIHAAYDERRQTLELV